MKKSSSEEKLSFVEALGGTGHMTLVVLAELVSAATVLGLPIVVETSNPAVIFFGGVVVFALSFYSAWKIRGARTNMSAWMSAKLKAQEAERENRECAKRLFLSVDTIDLPLVLNFYMSSGYIRAAGIAKAAKLEGQGVIVVDSDGNASITQEWRRAVYEHGDVMYELYESVTGRPFPKKTVHGYKNDSG